MSDFWDDDTVSKLFRIFDLKLLTVNFLQFFIPIQSIMRHFNRKHNLWISRFQGPHIFIYSIYNKTIISGNEFPAFAGVYDKWSNLFRFQKHYFLHKFPLQINMKMLVRNCMQNVEMCCFIWRKRASCLILLIPFCARKLSVKVLTNVIC